MRELVGLGICVRCALAHDVDSNKYRATSLSDKMETFKMHLDKVGGDYSEAPCEHAWEVDPSIGQLRRVCFTKVVRPQAGGLEISGQGGLGRLADA